ncbi:MAG: DUF4251 domain-containing protein [Leeuwenhoekiella sp.]
MKKLLLILLPAIFLFGCEANKNASNYQNDLKQIIDQREIHIESDVALPFVTNALMAVINSNFLGVGSTANQVNLTGNSNFLEIKQDSVRAYLPYFGERRMGGGYAQDSGIEFEGVPEDFEIVEKNGKLEIRFTIDGSDSSENYQVFVTIYGNLSSLININSTQRTPIGYRGTVSSISDNTI